MATSPPSYHHGNLREALLAAAVEAVREGGPDGLGVRDAARRVGVSHNAAYRHFEDRQALVRAVAEVGLSELTASIQRRLDPLEVLGLDPLARSRARLVEGGRGYVDFALAEPELFRLLFTAWPDPPAGSGAVDASGPRALLGAIIDELVALGHTDPASRRDAEVGCWATVHGFAALHGDGPLRELDPVSSKAALDGLLDCMLRSCGTGPAGRLDAG